MRTKRFLSVLMAVALFAGLTVSCDKELQPQQQDVVKIMKGTSVGDVAVTFPDFVNQKEEFTVTFEAQCGIPELQVWNNDPEVLAWEPLVTGDCEFTALSATMEDYGVYTFQVVWNEGCECEYVPLASGAFEITVCRMETAYAANTEQAMWDAKKAWWYSFDVNAYDGDLTTLVEGVVYADTYVAVGTVSYDGTNLTVVLNEGWILDPDCLEPVKITGYLTAEDLPNNRPTPGKMDMKGTELTIDVSGSANTVYVIHLDVKTCDVPNMGPEV